MNAAARALAEGIVTRDKVFSFVTSGRSLALGFFILSVMMSAMGVVYLKDVNRQMFSELQTLQKSYHDVQVESSQLLLEERTWTSQSRIQQIAQNRLKMVVPQSPTVVITNS